MLFCESFSSKQSHTPFPKQDYNPLLKPTFKIDEYETKWYMLYKSIDWFKPMISTLAPHEETLTTLGIKNSVYSWFGRASLKCGIGYTLFQILSV